MIYPVDFTEFVSRQLDLIPPHIPPDRFGGLPLSSMDIVQRRFRESPCCRMVTHEDSVAIGAQLPLIG